MDKRSLSERDICTRFITPALRKAGWDEMLQIREEVGFTNLDCGCLCLNVLGWLCPTGPAHPPSG